MYERFTDRARKVMQLANLEAQRFKHEYIGTEHILLGLLREGGGVAANALSNLGVDLQEIREEVEKIVQAGPDMITMGRLPKTPRARKVIEYAIEEAGNVNHNKVGTEHLLLGLLREEQGVAAQVLMNVGLCLDIVREDVLLVRLPMEKGAQDPFQNSGMESAHLPDHALVVVWIYHRLIEKLRNLKEEAVAECDFAKAAGIRDQEEQIKKARASFVGLWPK